MKALTFAGKRRMEYTTLADPTILHNTDAIVQVELCAVCGSDLHVYHQRETGLDCGTAMGHEFVGEVVELGSAVRQLRLGDKVVSPFTTNCGQCYFCNIGLTCRCTAGQLFGWVQQAKGLHGGQAELVRVPYADATLIAYDPQLSPETALLVGDIRSTGYHAAVQAHISPHGVYAVVGCGPVGLMCVLAAIELGAERVFAIDTIAARLSYAAQFGAIPINTTHTDAVQTLLQATDGRGADAVLEAVGSTSAMALAYQLLRAGGTISSVGVHTNATDMGISAPQLYDKNVTLRIGRAPVRRYMPQLLQVSNLFSPLATRIITHRWQLEQGAAAYHLFDTQKEDCIKIVLKP